MTREKWRGNPKISLLVEMIVPVIDISGEISYFLWGNPSQNCKVFDVDELK
jgi:hypothetical protein